MDHAFFRNTCDSTRNPGIRNRISLINDPAKLMSPHCLNNRMHVHSCRKSGTKCNRKWCHIYCSPKIFLCKDSVDHCRWFYLPDHRSNRIDHQRNFSMLHEVICLRQILCKITCNAFHSVTFLIDRLRKSNLAPDCGRIRNFSHQNRITALVQFINCARGDIPAAADGNDIFFHFPCPLRFYDMICLHHCLRDHIHIGHGTDRQFFSQPVMVQTRSTGHDLHALRLHAL